MNGVAPGCSAWRLAQSAKSSPTGPSYNSASTVLQLRRIGTGIRRFGAGPRSAAGGEPGVEGVQQSAARRTVDLAREVPSRGDNGVEVAQFEQRGVRAVDRRVR